MNRLHLAALLLVPALALTACGGDGGKPRPSAPARAEATDSPSDAPGAGDSARGGSAKAPAGVPTSAPPKVVNAFVACMRRQGVKVPKDTTGWRPDPQDGRTQKALMACMKSAGAPRS
ncbi:hypothetical protein [Actinomadura citrea]|uniref:Lipoprotein n=1 Tax=Actinomadura citrea TaxID=46158 RepID=A0A7Y9G5Q7_9ACTN|nr:hypothetical protein [Actinomadura citrea]NYE10397.1 hypothetical protein [Actinomadura citrea]GGT71932.1 hypothetical protein GCM10010177_32340 [Actinomadura citrea]